MIIIEYPAGATPIDPDEAAGLKLEYIATQSDLNAAEQENIAKAQAWLAARKRIEVLNEKFVRDLHRRMFGDVWKWAGTFRQSDKNIGISWKNIAFSLKQLLDNTRYWIESSTFPIDEIGARFHHQLVSIHCFPNGNGRHARLATDALLLANGKRPFTWGSASLTNVSDARQRYLAALRAADGDRYEELLIFARA